MISMIHMVNGELPHWDRFFGCQRTVWVWQLSTDPTYIYIHCIPYQTSKTTVLSCPICPGKKCSWNLTVLTVLTLSYLSWYILYEYIEYVYIYIYIWYIWYICFHISILTPYWHHAWRSWRQPMHLHLWKTALVIHSDLAWFKMQMK